MENQPNNQAETAENLETKTENDTNEPQEAQQPVEVAPTRWEIELEFVQSFANLNYLNYLAQNKYLEDDRFMSYLKYLYNYWSQPENLQFIIYPNCLHVLRLLLESKTFKYEILKKEVADVIIEGMVNNWKKTKSVEGEQEAANGETIEQNGEKTGQNGEKLEQNGAQVDEKSTQAEQTNGAQNTTAVSMDIDT